MRIKTSVEPLVGKFAPVELDTLLLVGMSNEKLAELDAGILCAVMTATRLRDIPAGDLHKTDDSEFHKEPSQLDPPTDTC